MLYIRSRDRDQRTGGLQWRDLKAGLLTLKFKGPSMCPAHAGTFTESFSVLQKLAPPPHLGFLVSVLRIISPTASLLFSC